MNIRFSYYLLIFTLLLLSSCGAKNNDDNKVFRYNQIGGLESLDPAFAKNLSIMWGVKFLYNTLVEVDTNLNIVPSLAKRWEVSSDGLSYTFYLRSNVLFHDHPVFKNAKGRVMNADDVVYSFNRLIDPKTASSGAWIFNDRVRTKDPFIAINDTTVVIHLSKPFKPLPQILSMPYCSIIPKEIAIHFDKDFRNNPCGTGPFFFKFWDEGSLLILKRNPNYWEKDSLGNNLPYLEEINVSFHETRVMEFLLFKQGKLDFINGIDGSMKDLILTKRGELKEEHKDNFNLDKLIYLNTEYLGILVDSQNIVLKNNPLRIKKVRQAINYSIDRNKIITYFRNGIGKPAFRGFIPTGMPGSEYVNAREYTYDPAKALQLLEEAGFPHGENLPLIVLSTPDANVDVCNFVVKQLNDIGIKSTVEVVQPGLLRQLMSKSSLPFFKAQWIADYPDAETFLAFFFSELPAPPNYTRFNNKVFDQWYQQSLMMNNDTDRYKMYAQMDSLISEEAPVVALFYDELIHFTQKNIQGLKRNSLNMIDVKSVRKITE